LAGHAHRSTVAAPARPQRSTARIVGDRGPPLGRSGAHPGSDPLPLETGRGNGHRRRGPFERHGSAALRVRRGHPTPSTTADQRDREPGPPGANRPRNLHRTPPHSTGTELRADTARGEILALLVRGHTDREIGQQLTVSSRTVNVHVAHILRKLNAANRHEAAATAQRLTPRGGPGRQGRSRGRPPSLAPWTPTPTCRSAAGVLPQPAVPRRDRRSTALPVMPVGIDALERDSIPTRSLPTGAASHRTPRPPCPPNL